MSDEIFKDDISNFEFSFDSNNSFSFDEKNNGIADFPKEINNRSAQPVLEEVIHLAKSDDIDSNKLKIIPDDIKENE